MISQFILGVSLAASIAIGGGEFVTRRRPQFLPTSILQRKRTYRFNFRFTRCVLSYGIGPWKLDLPQYLSYTVRNSFLALHLGGDSDSDHPTDFLTFSLIVYLVLRANLYQHPMPSLFKTIAQDATYYFLVIFTSHLMLELTLLFARVRGCCHGVQSCLYGLLRSL